MEWSWLAFNLVFPCMPFILFDSRKAYKKYYSNARIKLFLVYLGLSASTLGVSYLVHNESAPRIIHITFAISIVTYSLLVFSDFLTYRNSDDYDKY
jgi:hypothetical protein